MNSKDDDGVVSHAKVHGVRKSRQNTAPNFGVHGREFERTGGNASNEGFDGIRERATETWPARLIPLARLKQLVFGLRPEDDISRHFNRTVWIVLPPRAPQTRGFGRVRSIDDPARLVAPRRVRRPAHDRYR